MPDLPISKLFETDDAIRVMKAVRQGLSQVEHPHPEGKRMLKYPPPAAITALSDAKFDAFVDWLRTRPENAGPQATLPLHLPPEVDLIAWWKDAATDWIKCY